MDEVVKLLLSYGVLGVVLVAFIAGIIVPGWIYKQVVDQLTQARADNALLREAMEEKLLPALIRANDLYSVVLKDKS